MSHPPGALQLDAGAESVRRARAWVRDAFDQLDRKDLADSAEEGVSELVTNALLHAAAPITVLVRGTSEHPRVEVRDGSRRLPVVTFDSDDEDQLFSTFGRGLGLVAMQSTAWGVDLEPEGKVVWFVPAAEPRLDQDLSGEVHDLASAAHQHGPATGPDRLTRVQILELPVAPWNEARQWYYELAREVRLLGLSPSADYATARRFSEVFREAERQSRRIQGLEQLAAATARHQDSVSLDLRIPQTLPGTIDQLVDVLEQVDELCRQERMLTLPASAPERRLLTWWFSEFVRQAAGEEPVSWPTYAAGTLARRAGRPSRPGAGDARA